MDNQTLAGLLASTPPARLSIIELTADLTWPDGSLDLDAEAARQHEVELACAQGPGLRRIHEALSEAMRWKLFPRHG